VWSALPEDEPEEPSSPTSPKEPVAQLMFAVFKAVVTRVAAHRTMQFQGVVQHIPVNILLDSGSSSSFINEAIVQQLTGVQTEASHCQVHVAGGGILQSSIVVRQLQWAIGSCSFQSDFRVLNMAAYDIVVQWRTQRFSRAWANITRYHINCRVI
jgi:hypothetical protein